LASKDANFIMVSKSGRGHGHAFNLLSSQSQPPDSTPSNGELNSTEEQAMYASLLRESEEQSLDTRSSDSEVEDSLDVDRTESEVSEETSVAPPELPKDVIDDSSLLGSQIRVATTKLSSSKDNGSNQTVLTALAFRGYEKKQNANESNVIRLVVTGSPLSDMDVLKTTICAERFKIPKEHDPKKILFHPKACDMGGDVIKAVMATISVHAKALTCWQRTADWFVLRTFHITGTMGDYLSNHCNDARVLLHEHPVDCPQPTYEDVASKLRKSWVFHRGLSTPDMKSGTMNEGAVMSSLQRQPYTVAIFEAGLLQSKEHRMIAVSPDGVGVVYPPAPPGSSKTYVDTDAPVTCSVEIKTRMAPHMIVKAQKVVEKMQTKYFACTVGDATWWDAVPLCNRSQVGNVY
jgi:hypothetical protein